MFHTQTLVSALALAAVLLCLQPALAKPSGECKMTSKCFFDCGHTVMDLTPLLNKNFMDQQSSNGAYQYSLSPCGTLTEGSGCIKTHACQKEELGSTTTDIGSIMTHHVVSSGGDSYLQYTHTQDNKTRVTKVFLQCRPVHPNEIPTGDNDQLQVAGSGESPALHYTMNLTSPHACFTVKQTTTTAPPQTTANTTKPSHTTEPAGNQTTASSHTTVPPTTAPASHNVTTAAHNMTTVHHNVTTPAHSNLTTAHHNITTPAPHHNVTTAAHNLTTVHHNVTTPAHSNVTTAHHNVTTPAPHNMTTVHHITTPHHGGPTTQGHISSTHHGPTGAADTIRVPVLSLVLSSLVMAMANL